MRERAPNNRVPDVSSPNLAEDSAELVEQIKALAIVRGQVTLSSGVRPTTTSICDGSPRWGGGSRHRPCDARARCGLGLSGGRRSHTRRRSGGHGDAACHRVGRERLDAFVVRKEGKAHGLQRRIEGPAVSGRRVLAVEDTSTTGASVLTAVEALREAGADVIGVAVIVDRNTGAKEAVEAAGLAVPCGDLGS